MDLSRVGLCHQYSRIRRAGQGGVTTGLPRTTVEIVFGINRWRGYRCRGDIEKTLTLARSGRSLHVKTRRRPPWSSTAPPEFPLDRDSDDPSYRVLRERTPRRAATIPGSRVCRAEYARPLLIHQKLLSEKISTRSSFRRKILGCSFARSFVVILKYGFQSPQHGCGVHVLVRT